MPLPPIGIVVGGASGIGEAVVSRLLEDGLRVIVVDRDASAMARCVSMHATDRLRTVEADVTTAGFAKHLAKGCEGYPEGVTFLVNVAAIVSPSAPIHEVPTEDFDRVVAVNLRGPFLTMKVVAEHMIRRGITGAFVNIGSSSGLRPIARNSPYCSTKAAVHFLSQSVAQDLAPHGIRVNVVVPGLTDTPMFRNVTAADSDTRDFVSNVQIPLRRIAEPREIAEAVAWMVSDKASYCTGSIMVVDGGKSI